MIALQAAVGSADNHAHDERAPTLVEASTLGPLWLPGAFGAGQPVGLASLPGRRGSRTENVVLPSLDVTAIVPSCAVTSAFTM